MEKNVIFDYCEQYSGNFNVQILNQEQIKTNQKNPINYKIV